MKTLVKGLLKWLSHPPWHPAPIDRWKAKFSNGYVVDKRVFLAMMGVILLGLLYAFNVEGWDFNQKVYLHCPGPTPCENPLLGRCNEYYCLMEQLPPGFTIGEPMSKTYDLFPVFVMAVVMAAVFVNHRLHNKDFEPPEGVLPRE